MSATTQIDLSDEPADIGVGYGLPPWDDADNFVVRICDVRLLLSDSQIERLRDLLGRYFGPKTGGQDTV